MANQVSDVLNMARILAKTDTNGISDTDGILLVNSAQTKLQTKMTVKRKDLFHQDSYRDITSVEIVGGASPGRFLLPSDCMLVENIRINYQDTANPSMWATPDQVDLSNLREGITWEWLKANQPQNAPLILWHGNWFEIAPTPIAAILQALNLAYFSTTPNYSATTDFISYPYTINTDALANEVAALYYKSFQDANSTALFEGEAMDILKDIIAVIGAGAQPDPRAKGQGDAGWTY